MTLLLEIGAAGWSSPFRFHVPGGFEPRLEPEWQGGEITELREVWELPGLRLLGTQDTLWAEWQRFLGAWKTRAPKPTVRLLQIQGSNEVEVWQLGPPEHEDLRIETLSVGPDTQIPQATWRSLVPITLLISATQRFADTEGVVGWEQDVSNRYDSGGLQILEWRTRVTTRAGTSAVELARRLGRIDVRPFGDRYSYETNGPHGVEVDAQDTDERTKRAPTEAEAICRIRQWGVRVGVQGPGAGPSEVGLQRTTRRTSTGVTTTVRASARGPGARRWVEAKAPANASTSEITEEEAIRRVEAVWTLEGAPTRGRDLVVHTELSGGQAGFDYEPVVGGYPPVVFDGAILPWRLLVKIRAMAADRDGLRVPQQLPKPWRLDAAGSSEGEPRPEGDRWICESTLLYWSATPPKSSPREQLANGPRQPPGLLLAVRP